MACPNGGGTRSVPFGCLTKKGKRTNAKKRRPRGEQKLIGGGKTDFAKGTTKSLTRVEKIGAGEERTRHFRKGRSLFMGERYRTDRFTNRAGEMSSARWGGRSVGEKSITQKKLRSKKRGTGGKEGRLQRSAGRRWGEGGQYGKSHFGEGELVSSGIKTLSGLGGVKFTQIINGKTSTGSADRRAGG